MDGDRRRRLIEGYRQAPLELQRVVEAAPPQALDASPGAGAWSPREILNHLADAELVTAYRVRRMVAEDRPRISAYDENEYAERLHYRSRSVRGSLALIRAVRESTADLLEALRDADWASEGIHEETGVYTVETWLARQEEGDHVREHTEQLRRALAGRS